MPSTTLGTAQIGLFVVGAQNRVGAMYEFNCFNFRDPMGQPDLRELSGISPAVQLFIADDPKTQPLIDHCLLLAHDRVKKQNDPYLSLLFRDHHGKWISRALAELVSKALEKEGYRWNILDYTTK